jgi:glutamate N-acetyltransferase/amino-acid N-acetyltransferase
MTSDTRPKTVSVEVEFAGKKIKLAGMAKGAGMIEPNMATMLAFIVSDAKISQSLLKECLKFAANKSFNRITVDGDMSTNDTVLCLCNGASGVEVSEDDADSIMAFRKGLLEASRVLARKIVGDGEKITKVVEVNVLGAKTEEQAEKICRAIGNSLLVKSSWYGQDPNWGRITDAAGYARTGIVLEKIDLDYDGIPVLKAGQPIAENKPRWVEAVSKKTFTINLNLNLGSASESILAADLTDGYVNFNKGE